LNAQTETAPYPHIHEPHEGDQSRRHALTSILIVSQPARDGVLRHVDLLCRYLIAQGIRLHLAYSHRNASGQLYALLNHVADHGGQTLNLNTGNSPQLADIPALMALRRLIQQERPQVIHAHSSKAGGLIRGLGLLGLRTPIFYTPHAYYRMHDTKNWKARIFHVLERFLGGVGTSIGMGTSEAQFARDILKVPASHRIVIPNGINTRRYRPASTDEKRALREEYGLPPDVPLLGTVGRFSAQKDPVTLYAALARVFPNAPDLWFAHLGHGELEPEVDAFLAGHPFANRIKRIGYLADSAPFYQMLDGFVLSSRYEGMSYGAMEAFACGLPAVLTDVPGNLDLAAYEFSHVWKAKPGDAESIADAILAWRRSGTRALQTNHCEIMVRRFAEDICNSHVLAAYENAIAGGGDPPRKNR
jgi:glycosyltransferase involved in cell wall biosynthesis